MSGIGQEQTKPPYERLLTGTDTAKAEDLASGACVLSIRESLRAPHDHEPRLWPAIAELQVLPIGPDLEP